VNGLPGRPLSGSGDKVEYVALIEDIVPFSKDHFEKSELLGGSKPGEWIERWRENINNIQHEPWKHSLVITKIDEFECKMSALRNPQTGNRVTAPRGYCNIKLPEKWAGFSNTALIEDLDSIKGLKRMAWTLGVSAEAEGG